MDKGKQNIGHRRRIRDKFLKAGGDGWHDYELLELLLAYAIPRRDVKPLAKELIARFGGLSGVMDATADELRKIPGVGASAAGLIKLNRAINESCLAAGMSGRDVLSCPRAVLDFARAKLAGLPHESFLCIYLNARNEVLGHRIVASGTVDRAAVYPRRIIEEALACHAAGMIMVHNHPSGHCQPSPEDRALTESISGVAHKMDLKVLDHIIVGRAGYFSFAEKNLLP